MAMKTRPSGFPDVVDRANIRMVQGRGGTRLALKAVAEPGVVSKVFRQKLQGNETAKASVLRLVNDTHTARAQLFQDTVVRDGAADHDENSALVCEWYVRTRLRVKPNRSSVRCSPHKGILVESI